jgi:hypothetical protein
VNPASAAVVLGGTQQFRLVPATGTGAPLSASWSVNNIQGGNSTVGTIDSTGKYTAPKSFPSANILTVTGAASSGTGSANLIVVFPNDNHSAQSSPVKLGTTGGNSSDKVTDGVTTTCCSGTLGSLIQRGGTFFILSNNHILSKSDAGAPGDAIGQPGLVDNNCNPGAVIANLSEHAALRPTTITNTGACANQPAPCGQAPSNVDAAIAAIVAGGVDTSGAILDLGPPGTSRIGAAPPSATVANPATVMATNEGVTKSGRSTGLTCSTVESVATTVSVVYDAACGGPTAFTATFLNQIIIGGGGFSASGDSGSLIVTSDTARPVGLLYGGNSSSTSANPIQDVLAAFTNGSGTPAIVGGGDHKVSCDPTASSPAVLAPSNAGFAALTVQERERVALARKKNAPVLMQDPAVKSVTAGASEDHPEEGALVIHISGSLRSAVPAVMDGVRTKIVAAAQGPTKQLPVLSIPEIDRALAVKTAHADALMAQGGGAIQGVGVGRSNDNPAEAAIVVYVLTGMKLSAIPATIDGVRTKIVEGDRFRAFGWGKADEPVTKCGKR